jgi:hypothetical protein
MISSPFLVMQDSRPVYVGTKLSRLLPIYSAVPKLRLPKARRFWTGYPDIEQVLTIPLYGILVTHNYGSILGLIIAFVGAYAGWGVHLAIQKILKPT